MSSESNFKFKKLIIKSKCIFANMQANNIIASYNWNLTVSPVLKVYKINKNISDIVPFSFMIDGRKFPIEYYGEISNYQWYCTEEYPYFSVGKAFGFNDNTFGNAFYFGFHKMFSRNLYKQDSHIAFEVGRYLRSIMFEGQNPPFDQSIIDSILNK